MQIQRCAPNIDNEHVMHSPIVHERARHGRQCASTATPLFYLGAGPLFLLLVRVLHLVLQGYPQQEPAPTQPITRHTTTGNSSNTQLQNNVRGFSLKAFADFH